MEAIRIQLDIQLKCDGEEEEQTGRLGRSGGGRTCASCLVLVGVFICQTGALKYRIDVRSEQCGHHAAKRRSAVLTVSV